MKFKFTQNIEFDEFADKVKSFLEILSPKIKNTSKRVFDIRLSMEKEETTFVEVAQSLFQIKADVDKLSIEIQDHIEALVGFHNAVLELNQQQELAQQELAEDEEQKNEENL